MARISVVIPLFNKAKYIEKALKSITLQSLQPFEIVVVDDGSTDGGAALALALKIPGLRYFYQANQGVSVARNRGIAEAQGDYIAFLDADDCYMPDFLQTINVLITKFADARVFATGYACMWPDGRRVVRLLNAAGAMTLVGDFYRNWSLTSFASTSSIVVERLALQGLPVQFPPGERLGEDQDLWFRLVEKYPMAYASNVCAEYRMEVPGSAVASVELYGLLPCYVRLAQRLDLDQVPRALRNGARRLVAIHYLNTANLALQKNDIQTAWRLLFDRQAYHHLTYWVRTAITAILKSLKIGVHLN